jgi:hypothetical protein
VTARDSSKSQARDAGPAQTVISPDLMRAALERMGGRIAILAGRDLRYLFVNAAYQALVPGLAMVGRTFAEVFPVAPNGLEAAFRSVPDTGEPRRIRDDVALATGEPDVNLSSRARSAGSTRDSFGRSNAPEASSTGCQALDSNNSPPLAARRNNPGPNLNSAARQAGFTMGQGRTWRYSANCDR